MLTKARSAGTGVRILAGSGAVRPFAPQALANVAVTYARWGTGPAGGFKMLAQRYPDRLGVIDERGSLTFAEINRRANAVAHQLAARGVTSGDGVAVMCRNHRGFVDATLAAGKLGADALLLNTAFAGPQLVDVLAREKPAIVVADEEFLPLLDGAGISTVVAWTDAPAGASTQTLEGLIAAGDPAEMPRPGRSGRVIILTSGTTGTPKGAPRNDAGVDAAIALLSRMPLREGWRTHIAAPMFHTWGFAHFMLTMLLGSTMVLRRRFDPLDALITLEEQQCDSFVVIPVMLQRIMALPAHVRSQFSLDRVRVVAASGSALAGDLALEWMDAFGDNLYNIYGSTEVAYASIATPQDLRLAPGAAGKPPWGTVVKIFDEAGRPVPHGRAGRIFVGNGLLFEGYTGGGGKDVIDGLMSTGDVGRFDRDGRLHVEGRDDEMIVSGGENVFPKEVEDCLTRHPGVVEAAAVGVEDAEFGARLRAFVVVADVEAPTEDELRQWVRSNLARYKVPREFVVLAELPRNATGKILKRELMNRESNRG
ncbi:long-chain-fatty-acid--CoA ligase FadD2 [soil metagenome]